MIRHYLLSAWRNFFRHKTSTSISVLGLSLGLACFIIAVGAITYLNGADRHVPDADRVVAIMERRTSKEFDFDTGFTQHSSSALAQAIRKEFPELSKVTRLGGGIGARAVLVDGRSEIVDVRVADTDYLSVLNWPKLGSTDENPLAVPMGVVLDENTAQRLFGTAHVIGRTLELQSGAHLTVSAVLRAPPLQSHVGSHAASVYSIEAIISDETDDTLQRLSGRQPRVRSLADQWFFSMGTFTYAKLPKDHSLDVREFERRLAGIAERNGASEEWRHEFRVVPLSATWITSLELNYLPFRSGLSITTTLLLVAGLVLAVSCANYVTLAFAQALRRAKESGVRRTIGATRRQLGFQAIVEASCHVAVAVAFALAIVALIDIVFERRTGIDALGAIAESAGFWMSLTAMALIVSIAAGVYPALILARIRPSQIVRSDKAVSIKGRSAWMLLGVQFAITGALISVLSVVYLQNIYSRSSAFSSHADEQIFFGLKWNAGNVPFETWRTELLRSSAIKSVSATSNRPWSADFGFYPFVLNGRLGTVSPISMAVQYDFEKVLGLNVIAGRSFDRAYSDIEFGGKGQASIVIDETLARTLGFNNPQEAVGQIVTRHDEPASVRVIGVIKDRPLRLLPFLDRTGNAYQLYPRMAFVPIIRVDQSRLTEALTAIDATWKRLNPTEPVDRQFVDESFEQAYAIYGGISKILTSITMIALLIAILGGFGFSTFIAARRAHEIGVRKTLGARTVQIIAMLLRDFSKPVLIANIIVWPLAYFAAQKYLGMFVQRIDLNVWPFAFGLVFTLLIACLAAGRQALRAASVNPADVLRHE